MTGDLDPPRFVSADDAWIGHRTGPAIFRIAHGSLVRVSDTNISSERILAHIPGTVFSGFTDSHVHLGLIDPAALVAGGIASVVDLGSDPHEGAVWKARGEDARNRGAVGVRFAGAFLTAPGGYPSTRDWAQATWIREVSTPEESAAAIDEMASLGADRIKIALNAQAGPVWSDQLLAAVIAQSHSAGLPVVAHAEGEGQAVRAAATGADVLAHTPWTERLDDDTLSAMAAACSWTTTLDIHGYGSYGTAFEIAIDNLARFVRAGGRIRYGTDLGNGPLPVGLNVRELGALLAAGIPVAQVIDSLTLTRACDDFGSRISWVPGTLPQDPSDHLRWLSRAAVVPIAAVEELFA